MTTPIEIRGLTKRFGSQVAVDDLGFDVAPGRVTGFLGPNGSGKTTTLRVLLGLVTATSGTATIGGVPYRQLPDPARQVGAVLEATSFHPGRRARDHLLAVARAAHLPATRVDEVLGQVGLAEVGRRRVRGYSLGMRQRLQLATALLGDPGILILDEPSNGLDPQGIQWLRTFLRYQAGEGRTVLVSSHQLAEMEETVDDVVIVSHGRLVRQAPLAELAGLGGAVAGLHIRTPETLRLRALLDAVPVAYRQVAPDALDIDRATPEWFGPFAAEHRIVLYELVHRRSSLEDVFLALTQGFEAAPPGPGAGPGPAGPQGIPPAVDR